MWSPPHISRKNAVRTRMCHFYNEDNKKRKKLLMPPCVTHLSTLYSNVHLVFSEVIFGQRGMNEGKSNGINYLVACFTPIS